MERSHDQMERRDFKLVSTLALTLVPTLASTLVLALASTLVIVFRSRSTTKRPTYTWINST